MKESLLGFNLKVDQANYPIFKRSLKAKEKMNRASEFYETM